MNNISNKTSKPTDNSSDVATHPQSKISKLSYTWNPTSPLFVKEIKTWGQSFEARIHCFAISIICVPMCLWNGMMVPTTLILYIPKAICHTWNWIENRKLNPIRLPHEEIISTDQLKGHLVRCAAYLIGTLALIGLVFPEQAKTLHKKLGLIDPILQRLEKKSSLHTFPKPFLNTLSKDLFHLMANSFLDFSDYSSVMQTCSTLNKFGNESLLKWKAHSFVTDKMVIEHYLFLGKVKSLSQIPLNVKEIEKKMFTKFQDVKDFEILDPRNQELLKYTKNLNTLNLDLYDIYPLEINTALPELTSLELKGLKHSYPGIQFMDNISNISNLKILILHAPSYSFWHDNFINNIVSECQNLEKLSIKIDYSEYVQAFNYRNIIKYSILMPLSKYKKLREVEVIGVKMYDHFDFISEFEKYIVKSYNHGFEFFFDFRISF